MSGNSDKMPRFWEGLFDLLNKDDLHHDCHPWEKHWMPRTAGVAGLSFRFVAIGKRSGVELYIDCRGGSEQNKRVFDRLKKDQARINALFGDGLDWKRLNDRIASKIDYYKGLDGGWETDERGWPSLHRRMIDAMRRLIAAFDGPLKALGS